MKCKILLLVGIMFLISIPVVNADNKPAENPKDRITVHGRCLYIIRENTYPISNGVSIIRDSTDLIISHHGNGRLYLKSIDREYKDITIRIFIENTNIIRITDFHGIVFRINCYVHLIGLHDNMDITTW